MKCPNTDLFLVRIYSANLPIQAEYRKIWTRNNSCIWTLFTQCTFLIYGCEKGGMKGMEGYI